MNGKKKFALIIALAAVLCACTDTAAETITDTQDEEIEEEMTEVTVPTDIYAESGYDMNIVLDFSAEAKEISPYIYGVNQYGNQENYDKAGFTAVRQGGNRMTAYNWETNASNAGADWKFISDSHLSSSSGPADCALTLSREAAENGISYKLTTLQLAGYVAADKKGAVTEEETAPSERFNEVRFTTQGEFPETPDLTDGVVYMDEYVNYIIRQLGNSESETGIQGYSLDNEPALWSGTHSEVHPEPVTIAELCDKSIELAYAVKQLDPEAEIFGSALYGYTAYDHLADDDSSTEWDELKEENGYNWFIDCYLDNMRKASEEKGVRLLDVLDIHYYSESARNNAKDRVQSVRTLYEEGFSENSWIGQWCMGNVPILSTVKESIDKYYPETKLAITEYNFGGEDMSGTIVQAEALGCYADMGVYFASIWGGNDCQFAGIRLYTDYDGRGSAFGDMLISTATDDVSLSSAYAADSDGQVTVMITNKDTDSNENAVIDLTSSDDSYTAAAVYAVYDDSFEIRLINVVESAEPNKFEVTLPLYCAAMVVVSDDAADFPTVINE
ncbi:MAG: glycoside hydrolase family 44 protein [Oscillospiraceae bacterium]|nr:glycoside hydrolase family 44 protein [Oscillospiraceae bacterium]